MLDVFLTICLLYEQKERYTWFYNSQISLLQEWSQTPSVKPCPFRVRNQNRSLTMRNTEIFMGKQKWEMTVEGENEAEDWYTRRPGQRLEITFPICSDRQWAELCRAWLTRLLTTPKPECSSGWNAHQDACHWDLLVFNLPVAVLVTYAMTVILDGNNVQEERVYFGFWC